MRKSLVYLSIASAISISPEYVFNNFARPEPYKWQARFIPNGRKSDRKRNRANRWR